MIRFANSVPGRTIIVLMIAIGVLHVASLWTYQASLQAEITSNNDERLAERLVSIMRTVMRVPAAERELTAHALAGGPFDIHWSLAEHAVAGGPGVGRLEGMRKRLLDIAPELGGGNLVIGTSATLRDDEHIAMISMQLPDRSWVNVSVVSVRIPPLSGDGTLYSTTLMAGGLLLVAVLLLGWLTRPLKVVADAARQFSTGVEVVKVAESGPTEVKQLAAAFNEMQVRIKKLIDDRSQTLAAISHDLKSPLTRLRFRIEDVPSPETRSEIEADIGEMEAMIEGALAFLKGDRSDEALRSVDLASLVEAIATDFDDMGKPVRFAAPRAVVIQGRKLSLKRALTNVIENAIKYGGRADISVSADGLNAQVLVTDQGPGIDDKDKEAVFAPFHRLELSRNKETGGVGLGLTVARSIVRAHGGDVVLSDRAGGGLSVLVTLPAA
ncbi:ATP-binding protein [Phreatobacter stygius]|uniref:histidine kinase n=1 Tax=Phreatobacter stygius TaxID=1940610 RepID=A0A4D7B6M4_9HYPH|nr:ATP-binding protein [Phreatobacter stygius]QCI66028.1 HAMP domain-containing protein [Phreatobacter stygius]